MVAQDIDCKLNKTYSIYNIFPVGTPNFALYECLWVCFDHPASTTTVTAGTFWWYELFAILLLSLFFTRWCLGRSRHHSQIFLSVDINNCLLIVWTPMTAIVSANGVYPPPVHIYPQAAAKLVSQHCPPVIPCTLDDVENLNSQRHPAQQLLSIDANPAWEFTK